MIAPRGKDKQNENAWRSLKSECPPLEAPREEMRLVGSDGGETRCRARKVWGKKGPHLNTWKVAHGISNISNLHPTSGGNRLQNVGVVKSRRREFPLTRPRQTAVKFESVAQGTKTLDYFFQKKCIYLWINCLQIYLQRYATANPLAKMLAKMPLDTLLLLESVFRKAGEYWNSEDKEFFRDLESCIWNFEFSPCNDVS